MNQKTKLQIVLLVFAAITVPTAAYAVSPVFSDTEMVQESTQDYEIPSEKTQLRLESLDDSDDSQRIRGAR